MMATTLLLCDTPDEVSRLQYFLLREAPEVVVEVTNEPFRAIELAARTRPDAVVCELALEGLGGAEFVKRLRASAPGSRVLAWSLARSPSNVAEALAAGAAGYLVKQDEPDEVWRAVRAALHGGVTLSASVAGLLSEELSRGIVRVRELEDALLEIRTSVETGTTAKADFLSNVSHELRTPVTVAKGIAYVLRNPSVPDEERAQFLDQLQGALDKLMAIVDELITIAELERGALDMELEYADLAPLVRHAADDVARQYPAISIDAQVPESLPAYADGVRVGGVVRELLDNACRFSPIGRPVELRARVMEEGVTISVTDRGEGLHRNVVTQAFTQPFSTGEATLRKEKAGIGVGLHLARQIVVEHDGVMWADPLPGGGTRVSFCIPARPGARVATPPGAA
jgi:signal transduction histidine kinase